MALSWEQIQQDHDQGNLVHGSGANITPYPRRIVYVSFCAVSNYIRRPTRPDWIAHLDFAAIEPAPEPVLGRLSIEGGL
jgi:ectoine hydroxylase